MTIAIIIVLAAGGALLSLATLLLGIVGFAIGATPDYIRNRKKFPDRPPWEW